MEQRFRSNNLSCMLCVVWCLARDFGKFRRRALIQSMNSLQQWHWEIASISGR